MSLQRRICFSSLSLSLFLVGGLAACGGGSSGSGGSVPMYISTCSLGCSNGATTDLVSCSIGQHSRNGDVSVFFSDAIRASSVSPSTFQLIDVTTGQAPVGTRFVDSTDPNGKKMIFRPAVFFDNSGNTVFGFRPGATYRVTIAGQAHGDLGPFVLSTAGEVNQSRMQCDFTTTAVIDDLVAGPPRVSVLVQRAIPGNPGQGSAFEPADGLTDVWRDSQIAFRFNDIMNPATLLNPTTHLPTLITIEVQENGERVPLFGRVDISIDLIGLKTQLLFTPANGMPSGLSAAGVGRRIIATIPQTVTDLVGNGVVNPGEYTFTPETVIHSLTTLPDADGENFTSRVNEDAARSGADWGAGRLTRGIGGGSGRLGDLRVPTLQSMTLDADGTEFRNVTVPDFPSNYLVVRTTGMLDNAHPSQSPTGPAEYSTTPTSWPTVVVTDGVFEFSSLNIDVGASLKITGTKAARLFARGPVQILGTIDVRGEPAPEHESDLATGGEGGKSGPGGGKGGAGGDRYDNSGNDIIIGYGGIENPGTSGTGRRGTGMGGTGTRGGGGGGPIYPYTGITQDCIGRTEDSLHETLFSDPGILPGGTEGNCTVRQVSSPGGGGAYATSGDRGHPESSIPFANNPSGFGGPPLSNLPPVVAPGGDANTLGIEPPDPESGHRVRKLDAQLNLRGGSGGGGGGAQLFDTFQGNTTPNSDCYDCEEGGFSFLGTYIDHSACGGGGGGGAIQVFSGGSIHLAGSISASGGQGGSSFFSILQIPGFDGPRKSRACPGGGGSGGAIHLQGTIVELQPRDPNDPHDAPRIDVQGGVGGVTSANYFTTLSLLGEGGSGGAGLIRLEDLSGGTNPPATLMTRCSEAPKVAPYDATNDACGTKILSVGGLATPIHRPETFSAASSCWMRASGKYFQLDFPEDDPNVNPPTYGWNMDVVYHDPVSGTDVLTTYRGRDEHTPFPSGDFESNLGSVLNYLDASSPAGNEFGTGAFDPGRGGTYLAVRFQGAVADLDEVSQAPCDIVLMGPDSKIEAGSLTPWVSHPSELNLFRPQPNIIRFCVVFDRSLATGNTVSALINGVTNLRIEAQPD